MIEDIDYVLIKGKRWLPFGRKYKLLAPILHYSGDVIPTNFEWDGGTGVPMKFNDQSATAFLFHDYAFGANDVTVTLANTKCVQRLYKDVGLWLAVIIAFWFTILTPMIYGYFIAESLPQFKSVRVIANIIALTNITGIIALVLVLMGKI